jgi:hypothetical protein
MLVSHRIDHDSKVIITTFAPEDVTLKLFLETFNKYQDELKYLPDFQKYNELVDFRPITSINITASELKQLSNLASKQDTREIVTKLALLVDSKPAFTLAKVYEVIRNLNPASKKQVKVFQEFEEALDWVTDTDKTL